MSSQLRVKILHQEYLLVCPEGHEAQLMEAAERVDNEFQLMRERGKLHSRERVAVLLAVNLAFENLELRYQLQTLQRELATVQGTITNPQADLDAARLQEFEAQLLQDQATVNRLVVRLDELLANTAEHAHVSPDAAESTDSDEHGPLK